MPTITGLIQGLQWFFLLGMSGAIAGIAKLVFSAVLVGNGLALNGALGGLFLSTLLTFCFCAWFLRNLPPTNEAVTDLGIGVKNIISFTIPVVLSTLGLMALTNIDMVLVKHFFSPDIAGQYAQIAVLGRTIFYLPGIIVLALFPMVAESHALNKGTFRLLALALLATAALSGAGLLIFWIVPDLMLKILFGATFEGAAVLLRFFAIPMFLIALINVMINFLLAKDNHRFIYFVLALCGVEIILISFFHSTIQTVITILGCVSLTIFLLLLLETGLLFRKK